MSTLENVQGQKSRLWELKMKQNYPKILVFRRLINMCPWWKTNCGYFKNNMFIIPLYVCFLWMWNETN